MKLTICFVVILLIFGCASQEMLRVRQLNIIGVNLCQVPDGYYIGSYSYGGFEYKVKTAVKTHKIVSIDVVHNQKTKYAKRAEGVISKIVQRQTPNVDSVWERQQQAKL